jgi:hypothetical protein
VFVLEEGSNSAIGVLTSKESLQTSIDIMNKNLAQMMEMVNAAKDEGQLS